MTQLTDSVVLGAARVGRRLEKEALWLVATRGANLSVSHPSRKHQANIRRCSADLLMRQRDMAARAPSDGLGGAHRAPRLGRVDHRWCATLVFPPIIIHLTNYLTHGFAPYDYEPYT